MMTSAVVEPLRNQIGELKVSKNDEFCSKKTRSFALQTRNCVLKTWTFVFQMMNFARMSWGGGRS